MRVSTREWNYRILCLLAVLSLACGRESEPPQASPTPGSKPGDGPRPSSENDTIPAAQMEPVLRAHMTGLGAMERFEYHRAVEAFREVRARAPQWNAASINLAIALLNRAGVDANAASEKEAKEPYDEALELLEAVIRRDPQQLHARYCRGIILEAQGRLAEAHREFLAVAERDPDDAQTWYKVASTLTTPGEPDRPAGPDQADELIRLYSKAVERNPYLVSALYKLQTAYSWAGRPERQRELLSLWKRLNPRSNAAGPGETTEVSYGEMGRYASIIDIASSFRPAHRPGPPPRFEEPRSIEVNLPAGDRWVTAADFQGTLALVGRIRQRFGAGVATFDANGDGRLDLFLAAAVVGPKGVRDALLLNRGEGRFHDATAEFALPEDRPSLGIAAGDFDADRKLDVVLTGVGGSRLYRNLGQKLEDVSQSVPGLQETSTISLNARWLDLDQDGDLDLYLVNYAPVTAADAAMTGRAHAGAPNLVLRNDGQPAAIAGRPQDNWAPLATATEGLPATSGLSLAFSIWPESDVISGGTSQHTGIAALDLDDDRDLDLVIGSDDSPPVAILNDRLGRFHKADLPWPNWSGKSNGLLVLDLDKDGRADLASIHPSGRIQLWRNTTARTRAGGQVAGESWPTDATTWSSAVVADLDLDSWTDLVGFPRSDRNSVAWSRNEGSRLATHDLTLSPVPPVPRSNVGFALSDLVGDPLPDLFLLGEGIAPHLAQNLGNGHHWLALDVTGRWNVYPSPMRTNPQGLGTRVALEGEGLKVSHIHTTSEAGLIQSVGPAVLGLGTVSTAALLRLRWPDGTMQCELNVTADKRLDLVEHNRKTGSCPVLFTWNGERFVCQGDFLGGGGLGYLLAPGSFGQPDRDESVAIASEDLRAERGVFRLSVNEPMDECAYLDHLTLRIVDRPREVHVALDERFAPEGRRPTGEVVAWRSAIEPVRALDLNGNDVTDRLRSWDRNSVDGFARRDGWIGYAEDHGVVLDFGDRLSRFDPDASLVLCLAGWVEYPYSQTNYAASTAKVALVPPAIERRREDGSWEVIEPHAGYPAGLPRMMTLDLKGKLTGPSCTIRIRTNMECYWDRIFVALRERDLPIRETPLRVTRAHLVERGYLREVSPDGKLPLLYDYEHVDPVPLSRMAGRLTRLGDVAPLLEADDDQLCVIGPGDEVRLEFDASLAPELAEGWTRSYVLDAVGYCKDADPFTATSDTIEPLPWRKMPGAVYPPTQNRPDDPAYRAYLDRFQTRRTEAR